MDGQALNDEQQVRQWAIFLHFSQFAGYVVPVAGFLAPIIIWQIRKTDMPALYAHGKIVVNWILSELVYAAICVFFVFMLIGIPPLIILGVLGVSFPIIGVLKQITGSCGNIPYPLGS